MIEIMQSIKPKWCELIISGRKTIEVRKTRPKCDTPFKCYIYCTKFIDNGCDITTVDLTQKVIGEYICDAVLEYEGEFVADDCCNTIHQIVRDEDGDEERWFETSNEYVNPDRGFLVTKSCLTFSEIKKYVKGNKNDGFFTFYGWHISDLQIYDTPKDIREFRRPCVFGEESEHPCFTCEKSGFAPDMHIDCFNTVDRPPQSWCYVHRPD